MKTTQVATNNISGKMVTSIHKRIHEGNYFSATNLFSGVADTSSVEMVGITGDKSAHLLVLVKATGEAEIEFEKGTTFTDNGTALNAVNRKETSTNTATASIYHTPTTDTAGTVFSVDLIPGGGKQNASIGGESGVRQEFVVTPNSNYVVRVTNTSGSSAKIFVEFMWYEI